MSTFMEGIREQMGLGALASGKYAKAEAVFRKLAKTDPDSLKVLHNLGLALMAQGKREEAEVCFRREEKLYGASYIRHCALADLAYSAGKRGEAVKRYKAALACPESGKDIAILAARLAISEDTRAFADSRLAAEAFARGEAARLEKRLDSALEEYESALALDPTSWPAANNAGTIYLNDLKDPGKALQMFGRAMTHGQPAHVLRNAELAERALKKTEGGRKASPGKDSE